MSNSRLRHRKNALPGAILASILVVGLTVGLPPTGAAESDALVEVPELAVPASPPLPVPVADREPIPAPGLEKGIRHPEQVTPIELPTTPSKEALTGAGAKAQPSLGGPNFDLFSSEGGGTHGALVYTDDINVEDSSGDWNENLPQLLRDAKGWRAEFTGDAVSLPEALAADSPVVFQLGNAEIASSLLGANPAEGHPREESIVYESVLPSTDVVLRVTPHGYAEELVLRGPNAPSSFTYELQSAMLSVRPGEGGQFLILDGGKPVGFIPTPVAFDSSTMILDSVPDTTLVDLGGGRYQLDIKLDEGFLARATYPVTIDPGEMTLYPTRDTFVNSSQPNTSFEGASYVEVGMDPTRRSFLRFDTGNLVASGRLVYEAWLSLFVINGGGTTPIIAKRPTQAWATPMTWNNQPPADQTIHGTGTPPGTEQWFFMNVPSLYQRYLDGTWPDQGVRLERSGPTARFVASEGYPTQRPTLFLSFNDLPAPPVLQSPGPDAELGTESPTLALAGEVPDPNGDPVLLKYQVSDSATDFTDPHLLWQSGWTDEERLTVPSGTLPDGEYWWRVQARDVCVPPFGLCSLTDGAGVSRSVPVSTTQRFIVSLEHLGDDPRYALWSRGVGNNMTLKVNEATGNLFLDLPLDVLGTPGGELALSLTYNHQEDSDVGLGPGWEVGVGPLASGGALPVQLTEPSGGGIPPGEVVAVRYQDGQEDWFTKHSDGLYRTTGQGTEMVLENSDGSFTLTTAEGDEFTFDSSGALIHGEPAAASPASGAAFGYTFNGSGGIEEIEDAIGRTVEFTWENGRLVGITTWDQRMWQLWYYTPTRLAGVTNPANETVAFEYDQYVAEIKDAQQQHDDTPGWRIEYQPAAGDPLSLPRVDKVLPPMPQGAQWEFDYTGPFSGTVAAQSKLTDPRGVATPGIANDYQVVADFSRFGLPVRIAGPADQHGYWPLMTQVWDTNHNLLCKRTPEANAVAEECLTTLDTDDPLSTVYAYETSPPYMLEEATEAASNPLGQGPHENQSYQYDLNLNGLWVHMFNNSELSGVPVKEQVWTVFDNQWGVGAPQGISQNDDWGLRWSGLLDLSGASETKNYEFRATSPDSYKLSIDNAEVLECPPSGGCISTASKMLSPGMHPIAIEYREEAGTASFKLEWNDGNGMTVMGPQGLKPNRGLVTKDVTNKLNIDENYPEDEDKAQGLPASEVATDPAAQDSRQTVYTKDLYGRPLSLTTAAGTPQEATTTYSYLDDVQTGISCLAETTGPTGAVSEYECNEAGRVVQATLHVRPVAPQPAQSRVTDTTYDAMGRVIRVEGSEGSRVETTFDLAGRLVRTEELINDGGTPADPGDDVVASTVYEYDGAGRLITETLPDPDGVGPLDSPIIRHAYDAVGNEIELTDARGEVWGSEYDSANRIIATITPTGLVTATDHMLSSSGDYVNRVTVTNPFGVDTVTSMDLLGRPISVKVGNFEPATYTYDVVGNVIRVTDPAGVWTEQDYNGFGDVVEDRRPYGEIPPPDTESWQGSQLTTPVANPPGGQAGSYEYGALRLQSPHANGGTPPNNGLKWPAGHHRVTFNIGFSDKPGGVLARFRIRNLTDSTDVAVVDQVVPYLAPAEVELEFDTEEGKVYQAQIDKQVGLSGYSIWVTNVTHEFLEGIATEVATTTNDYDSAGNPVETDGPRTEVDDSLTYEYDPVGRMTSATQSGIAGPNETQFVYDDAGEMIRVSDPEDRVREWTFDEEGRESSYMDGLGTTTSSYNPAGWLTSQQDPRGLILRFAHDRLGRQTRRWAEGGPEAISAATLTSGTSTTDASSYTTASISPGGNKLILAWVGNAKGTTPNLPTLSGNGMTWVQVATLTYGSIGAPMRRLTLFRAMKASPSAGPVSINFGGVTQTGAAWSILEFDGVDSSGTDGSGAIVQTATNRHNLTAALTLTLAPFGSSSHGVAAGFGGTMGSPVSINPDAGWSETHDVWHGNPNHRLETQWRPDNDTTSVGYISDGSGKAMAGIAVELKSSTVSAQDAESFAYDAAGNITLATVEGSGLDTVLNYDPDGRLISVDQGGDHTAYEYAPLTPGKLTSITDPSDGTTTFGYEENGRIETLTDPLTGQSTSYDYDNAGRAITRNDPAGLDWEWNYDAAGQVSMQTITGPMGEVSSSHLIYDAAGNVLEREQDVSGAPSGENGTWEYSYDGANRLISARDPSGLSTIYGYDGAGNRTSVKIGPQPPITTTYDSGGLPQSTSDGTTYDHDEVGNLTEESGGPGPDWAYGYDGWNRLASAEGPSAIAYVHDALGRVTTRTSGATTTNFHYIGNSTNLSSVHEGAVQTAYAYSLSEPLAQRTAGQTRFFIPDLHEDIVGLVSLSGAVTGTRSYSPWGDPRATSGEQSRLGFQGDLTDPETGLVNLVTRQYDSGLGRFTSRDSLFGDSPRPMSLNQFVYGLDNPLTFVDWDGMKPKKAGGGGGGRGGGGGGRGGGARGGGARGGGFAGARSALRTGRGGGGGGGQGGTKPAPIPTYLFHGHGDHNVQLGGWPALAHMHIFYSEANIHVKTSRMFAEVTYSAGFGESGARVSTKDEVDVRHTVSVVLRTVKGKALHLSRDSGPQFHTPPEDQPHNYRWLGDFSRNAGLPKDVILTWGYYTVQSGGILPGISGLQRYPIPLDAFPA